MEQRLELIREWKEGESIAVLAEVYGVSRKTVYKWIERYQAEGAAGLKDRSRAPHHRPQQLGDEMIAAILQARQRWGWGPRKLRVKLMAEDPDVDWPAASTIGEVLRRAGLTHGRKPRCRTPPYTQPFAGVGEANQTWCGDFKGWFRTGDGVRCDPLTITDAHSRYLLRCQIVGKTDLVHVEAIFDAAFREFGLPRVIRTDNGTPFASRAPGGLSRLSMRWVKLGIVPERTRPASPQENGRHERMHLTLKQEALAPPAGNPRRQQQAFHRFCERYNHQRPHEALDYKTPAECFAPSPRAMPRRVPELDYPPEFLVRRVSQQGSVCWKNERTFISEIFAYEPLGLRPCDERYGELFYGPIRLGWLDGFRHRFHRTLNRRLREQLGESAG